MYFVTLEQTTSTENHKLCLMGKDTYRGAPLRWATQNFREKPGFVRFSAKNSVWTQLVCGSPKWGTSVRSGSIVSKAPFLERALSSPLMTTWSSLSGNYGNYVEMGWSTVWGMVIQRLSFLRGSNQHDNRVGPAWMGNHFAQEPHLTTVWSDKEAIVCWWSAALIR